jgi:diguanylate cyclase (GGDEF)-like protein
MDPATVILMIAVHLISAGVLLAAIARRTVDNAGLWPWSLGALLLGLAYLARLVGGMQESTPLSVAGDAVMILAQLSVIVGLLEFAGRDGWRPHALGLAAAYAVAHLAITALAGAQARFVTLNLVMGVLYLAMAVAALGTRARFGFGDAVRMPLLAFAALVGLLGAATLVRGGLIVADGVENMYRGLYPAMYYTFGSVVGVLTSLLLLWIVFEQLSDRLRHAASHDALTGVYNRHGLREALTRHFRRPSARSLVMLAVDVDHFKRVNDQYGHGAGDALLRAVALELRAASRAGDIVARVGGEEFIVAIPVADPGEALAFAERLRRCAAGVRVATRAPAVLRCTVSIGASSPFDRLELWERATGEADRALYAAKAAGRNRCLSFEPENHTAPVDLAVV